MMMITTAARSRHCGRIICGHCSSNRAMLPQEYGMNDPQRVCVSCYDELLPMQSSLTSTLANHQRVNLIDTTKCLRRHLNMPFSLTLGSEIRKAAYSLHNLFETDNIIKDRAIPSSLLSNARGIAFLTVIKAGFGFGIRIGTGLVISRLPSGQWSAPTAIGSFGLSWGMLIGADITDFVIFLNTIDAIRAFAGVGQVSIGAGIDVALGPVGRSGAADLNIGGYGYAPALSYAHCRGLYAGVSLDGSVIASRAEVNHKFYGQRFTPMQILGGEVTSPRAAQPLYDALDIALASSDSSPCYQQVQRHPVKNMTTPAGKTIVVEEKQEAEPAPEEVHDL
jgi:SH3 domain-containing YSC84-like protein 1